MMEQMTVGDIVKATGGTLLCGEETTPLYHISLDSRTMLGNDLFIPIIGEKVDGHRFIEKAFEVGAVATFTSEHDVMEDGHAWIRVDDTIKALQDVGVYCRNRLTLPLVGITGSVGKTTTREMIATALSAKFQVYKTPGNRNSQVGLPTTLSEITSQDEIGVLELGMSEVGELTKIAKIARIHLAVITNIGVAHLEQLGSQENIFKEKMTIQDGLEDGGILLLNGDDPFLLHTKAKDGCSTLTYGTSTHCDYYAKDIVVSSGYSRFIAVCKGEEVSVTLSVLGKHNVLNAMAALAVADCYDVDLNSAAKALTTFVGFENRQETHHIGGITIMDDTYNANPVSMIAGIEMLTSMDGTRHIAVLADMKELGKDEVRFHQEVGTYLAGEKVEVLVTYGELAKEFAHQYQGNWFHFEEGNLDALKSQIQEMLKVGDTVLLKGSNSMKLKEVSTYLLGVIR